MHVGSHVLLTLRVFLIENVSPFKRWARRAKRARAWPLFTVPVTVFQLCDLRSSMPIAPNVLKEARCCQLVLRASFPFRLSASEV